MWAILQHAALAFTLCVAACACAQAQENEALSGEVQLNFPDNSELRLLVDYVSERLGIKILYDEAVANKRLTVRAPEKIPVESLLPVLRSALKIKGLALIEADVPGWKRIVESDDLVRIARPGLNPPLDDVEATEAITQAFRLKHVTPERLSEVIAPFLTEPGSNTLSLPDQNTLVVTDYKTSLEKIQQLVDAVDRAGPEAVLRYYAAEHVDAPTLQKQIGEVLAARISTGALAGATKVQITADERTNQLILVGPQEQVEEAQQIAKVLDVPLGLTTEVYNFDFVAAERVDRLVQELFDELTIKRLYQSAVDEEDNLLIATTTSEIHQRIEWLREQLDVEAKRPGSAIQFYKLKYADAVEVLQTIQSIRQTGSVFDRLPQRGVSALGRGRRAVTASPQLGGFQDQFVPGPNRLAVPGNNNLPVVPPAVVTEQDALLGQQQQAIATQQLAASLPDAAAGLLSADARVTADPTSNTIIVVADRATQEIYKNLIDFLDKRRPQVMIEAQVVLIDTTDSQSVGVEISVGDRSGAERLFEFTSFGLSTVDPTNGFLSLVPGAGFNWALIEPDVADAIIQALATHNRSKVVSAPRVLVDDNATGTLASVAEVPFTSINASDTVATTSFAGFAEAGTTIEVTPRISEEDFLQLEYVVTLNSFTGAGGDGIPPPRSTNEVASSVTIPDGYTVIVGGLNFQSRALDRSGIPFIEKIPVLRELTSIETQTKATSSVFVFLRPIILRDDKFEDLKYLSDRDLNHAAVQGNYPRSRPLLVK